MAKRTTILYICILLVPVCLLYYHLLTHNGRDKISDNAQLLVSHRPPLKRTTSTYNEKTFVRTHSLTNKLKILLVTPDDTESVDVDSLFVDSTDMLYLRDPLNVYNPELDKNISKTLLKESARHGYSCVNQNVNCRLDYLYSCRLLMYFNEALFRRPRNTQAIRVWYKGVMTNFQQTLGENVLKEGVDEICKKNYITVTVKTSKVKLIEDIVPLMEQGVKVIL